MEKTQRFKISKKVPGTALRQAAVCLEIPDNFEYMDPRLVKLLKVKVPRYVQV